MSVHPKIRLTMRNLINAQEFFAALLIRMNFVEDPTQPTEGTDGKNIFYNPAFWDTITQAQGMFELAHEACHPMLGHFDRRNAICAATGKPYDPKLHNMAGDYAINLLLKDAGFYIPKDALLEEQYAGWSTERIYADLWANQPPNKNGQGAGGAGQGKCCNGGKGLMAPAKDFDPAEFAQQVQQAAAVARGRGHLPGSLAAAIQAAIEPSYPLHLLLERFVDQHMRSEEQSWRRPHRDFLNRGIILPGPDVDERVSHCVVVYDTSGSIGDEELHYFHGLAGKVFKYLRPSKLTIITCDSKVDKVLEFKDADEWPSSIRVNGRGGTEFAPPFEYLAEKGIQPSCLVYLTDLEGDFPNPPSYPTLWVSVNRGTTAPFGQTVYLPEGFR